MQKMCLLLHLVLLLNLSIRADVEFQTVRFFESGSEATELSARKYHATFIQSDTRYIFYEVSLKNLRHRQEDQDVKIVAHYYYPDGSLFGSPELEYAVPKEWNVFYLWHGWGWDTPGNWTVGKYRVEISIDGANVMEASFSIVAIDNKIEIQSIQFFESSFDPPELGKRQYSTSFQQKDTRYIFYELYVKNLLHQKKDNAVKVVAHYYYPDGTLFGSPELNYVVLKDWDLCYLWHGWGWKEPGNWKGGEYRVEIVLNENVEKVGFFKIEGETSVKNPEPESTAESFKTNRFPEPLKLHQIPGSLAMWEVQNQTDYYIEISYQGQEKNIFSIPSKQTKTISLPEGTYSVYGYSGKPYVLPYFGSISFEAGWKYQSSFFIERK